MNLKYVNKIKANISISATKKTANLLDGTYKSFYKGKSLNFENLREYIVNDDIKDIDWKASARSGTLLIKQYVALKKHNIMLVVDTGKKMEGITSSRELKKELALFVAGTIGYVAINNGDYVGFLYRDKIDKTKFLPFKYNLYNLEEYLCDLESNRVEHNNVSLNDTLEYLYKNVKKKMIIFVITDLEGLDNVSEKTLSILNNVHDTLFVTLSDASITEDNAYDLEAMNYVPKIFKRDDKLKNIEEEIKKDLLKQNEQKLASKKICLVNINDKREINDKIIELLKRQQYASNN